MNANLIWSGDKFQVASPRLLPNPSLIFFQGGSFAGHRHYFCFIARFHTTSDSMPQKTNRTAITTRKTTTTRWLNYSNLWAPRNYMALPPRRRPIMTTSNPNRRRRCQGSRTWDNYGPNWCIICKSHSTHAHSLTHTHIQTLDEEKLFCCIGRLGFFGGCNSALETGTVRPVCQYNAGRVINFIAGRRARKQNNMQNTQIA